MLEPDRFPNSKVLFSRLVKHVRLRQLQLLLGLQQSGSIVQAAQQLHMSQSSATQALAELERVLDMRLFDRHARGIRPTVAGQALIDAVRSVMHELEEVAETLVALRLGASAALRLGAIPAAAHSILAHLLTAFYVQHPQVFVDVQEGSGAQLQAQLLSGRLDAVFCRRPVLVPEQCVFEPLLADEAVVVVCSSLAQPHPLAHQTKVPITALAQARWVLPTANIAVREIFEQQVLPSIPKAQWYPVSSVSLPVLEGFLRQPQSVALLPRSVLPALRDGGIWRVLDMDVQAQAFALEPLGALYRKESPARLLKELLQLWQP